MRAAAVRGDRRASLPAHKLPPVNTGTGALVLLQGRREGHAGQPRAEQRVGYLSADLALLTVTPHLQKHTARGAVKMDTAGERPSTRLGVGPPPPPVPGASCGHVSLPPGASPLPLPPSLQRGERGDLEAPAYHREKCGSYKGQNVSMALGCDCGPHLGGFIDMSFRFCVLRLTLQPPG